MAEPTHQSASPIPSSIPVLWLAAAAILVVAAYLPAMHGAFLFDDIPLLAGSTCWQGLEKVPAIFGLGEPNACTYRPIRYVTFALDYSVGGLNPTILHLSNVVYHLITGLLVFFVFRRWASAGAAALVVAIWLLHPVQADSVAYISGRRDLISTLFYVGAFLALLPRTGERLAALRVLAGAILFAIALGAKEMAVTLPAILLWAAWMGAKGDRRWLLSHLYRYRFIYLPLLVMAVAFVVHRGFVASHSGMQGRWWGGSPSTNFATSLVLLSKYLGLMVWPDVLVGDYFSETIPLATGFSDPRTLLGIGLLIGLLGACFLSMRRGWTASAIGIGWFLVTLLPVLHILPHHELFAEHYLYLPSIGLVGAGLPLVEAGLRRSKRTRWATILTIAVLLTACTLRTASRSADFESERTFYEAAAPHAPFNGRVLHYLAVVNFEDGNFERAQPLFLAASRQHDPTTRMGRDSLAGFLMCSDRLGTRRQVDETIARLLDAHPTDVVGLSWRGRRLFEQGHLDDAVSVLSQAVEQSNGRYRNAVINLAMTYNRSGRHEETLALIQRYPNSLRIFCEQEVLALRAMGPERFSEAFGRVSDCLASHPNSLILLEVRASLFYAAGRQVEAEADIARLIELGAPDSVVERLRALGQ